MKTSAYYQEDMAALHDAHYSGYSEAAAALLLQKLREQDILSGTIVDLGCGSGKLTKIIANAGYDTIGVDYSESLLEIARNRSPKTFFVHESIWDYQLPTCVAVTAIGEIINYMFDCKNSDERLKTLFNTIYDCLHPSGLLLFDFIQPGVLNGKTEDLKVVDQKEWMTVVTYHIDREQIELTRDITVLRKTKDDLYRKSREIHKVRLLNSSLLTEWLPEIGFGVEVLSNYGNLTFRDGHKAILARKPS